MGVRVDVRAGEGGGMVYKGILRLGAEGGGEGAIGVSGFEGGVRVWLA